MKMKFYVIGLAAVAMAMMGCQPEQPEEQHELAVLTFEDADAKFEAYTVAGKQVASWSDLIDANEYGGGLLYGTMDENYNYSGTDYRWCDEGNTLLSSSLLDGAPYWTGGHAISNYTIADPAQADYTRQLSVLSPQAGAAGHNGSKNFCVHNNSGSGNSLSTLPALTFADNKARTIDHLWITNTAYMIATLEGHNDFCPAATADTWIKVVATGYDASGTQTGRSEKYLCQKDKQYLTEWAKWDMSAMGPVVSVTFHIEASDDMMGDYGISCPTYFAYDDVAVRIENK